MIRLGRLLGIRIILRRDSAGREEAGAEQGDAENFHEVISFRLKRRSLSPASVAAVAPWLLRRLHEAPVYFQ